jgi:PTS system N-acetylglucosamine-specific IIC component
VLNRVLIVTGLHHILNNIAWFLIGDYGGVTGDLKRFFAGDPSAGAFMSGFFPVMMFGLPAACLAMYQAARPERRRAIGGLLASMALTSFLTGVTEPIEFTFMFLAPVLYALHALLTGAAMVLMHVLDVHLGFSFSAGLFDYLINFGQATHPLRLIPVGIGYGLVYYAAFRFAISKFDLKTPGRDAQPAAAAPLSPAGSATGAAIARGPAFVAALGGPSNLGAVDACTTRLRLTVHDQARVDTDALRRLGASGFIRPGANALQVVVGPAADSIAGDIRAVLRGGATLATGRVDALLAGLGGAGNVAEVTAVSTRLRILVVEPSRVDDAQVAAVARGVARPGGDVVHVLAGAETGELAAALRARLAPA